MKNNWKNWVIFVGGVGVGFFLLVFFSTSSWIGYSVKERCLIAQGEYGGDCVEALSAQLEDESKSLKDRNRATWALGQMGDERALPVLSKYFQGGDYKCDHEKELCQYELEKSINLIESGFNLTHFVWRR